MLAVFTVLVMCKAGIWHLSIQLKIDVRLGIRLLDACRFQGSWLRKESSTTSLWQAQGAVQVLLLVVIQMKGKYMICAQVCPVRHILFHLYAGKVW